MMDRFDTVSPIETSHPIATIHDSPQDVLRDRHLTKGEKRALLASWASDAAAVASQPHLRRLPGSHRLVAIDEILSALAALDDPPEPPGGKPARIGRISRLASLPLAA